MGGANTIVGKYAASAVATPPSGSVNISTFQAMVAQLAATGDTLSKTNRRGYGGSGNQVR